MNYYSHDQVCIIYTVFNLIDWEKTSGKGWKNFKFKQQQQQSSSFNKQTNKQEIFLKFLNQNKQTHETREKGTFFFVNNKQNRVVFFVNVVIWLIID